MKNNEPEQKLMTDAELDEMLAQMAEEAPPMPADFHNRWMDAVRAEAKEAKNAPAEESAPKHTVSVARWTRILSIAAVFIFLIGGTMLHRSTKKTLNAPYTAEKREAAAISATEVPADYAAGAAEQILEVQAETTEAEAPLMTATAMEDAEEASDPEAAGEENAMKAAGSVQNAFAATAGEAPDETAEWEAEAISEADYAEEAPAYDAAAPVPTAVFTAMPTATPAATSTLTPEPAPEPTAEAVPAEEPEPEQTGFLPAVGAFLTDMGEFLLAALPYLLVLAVPAAAALIIRSKKSRRS